METIMFTVGVLTMVLVALTALAVYSTVMVLRLKQGNNDFQRQIHDIYRLISEREDSLYRSMDEQNRELRLQMDQAFEQISQISERVDYLSSYVDRRIDKLIDGYLLVKETEKAEKESKKLIKG
jgi:predicted PurR-regulated permease PerM